MYHVSGQGVDERMINVHYYYYGPWIVTFYPRSCAEGRLPQDEATKTPWPIETVKWQNDQVMQKRIEVPSWALRLTSHSSFPHKLSIWPHRVMFRCPSKHAGSDSEAFWLLPVMAITKYRIQNLYCLRITQTFALRLRKITHSIIIHEHEYT